MKIALASPPFPKSINDGLYWLEKMATDAAAQDAGIICFPESYIPGYPLAELTIEQTTPEKLQAALDKATTIAVENNIAIILPMDWYGPDGLLNIAYVISNTGELLGYQTKNQLDPSEDNWWVPGTKRNIFEAGGLKFGIAICHEGFRYPEVVRWAARRDVAIVFHPHCSGSDVSGIILTQYRHKDSPYYEQAMMMRALENTIYFASTNYASKFSESASSVIAPDGTCLVHEAYGEVGVIVAEINTEQATGVIGKAVQAGIIVGFTLPSPNARVLK